MARTSAADAVARQVAARAERTSSIVVIRWQDHARLRNKKSRRGVGTLQLQLWRVLLLEFYYFIT